MLRNLVGSSLLVMSLTTAAAAQDARAVVDAAARAMGVDRLTSITYSGTARNGQFGQSKAIGEPLGAVNVTQIADYTRTITFAPAGSPTALVARATGRTTPPAVPGAPAQPASVFNQNITGAQATGGWTQALNLWTTPWGFLKAAAANASTVRQDGGQRVVTFSPAGFRSPSGQPYVVTGYVNAQNLVTKVETRVEHPVVGDLLVEFEYSGYQNMNGVQVPTRIVQKQAGLATFDANITAATPNPANVAELLTVPAPAGGAPGGGGGQQAAAGPPPVERIGEGVFKIGGNYASLAVDMGDHVLVVESGQNEARGLAVMAAARQAIPGKPVRYVVNSHPHFDHAGGLAAALAEGAQILTHRNNEDVLQRFLAGPRTLGGDALSKAPARGGDPVEGVTDRDIRRGTNGKVVELHRIPNEHSDGLLAVYLPDEKALWTADVTIVNPTPVQLGVVRAAAETFDQLGLDYETWIPAHPPTPDRRLTRADVRAALGN
jgi:glyoxylase-like metal-dependent hydrolase (beta-lactamase superfamily II)